MTTTTTATTPESAKWAALKAQDKHGRNNEEDYEPPKELFCLLRNSLATNSADHYYSEVRLTPGWYDVIYYGTIARSQRDGCPNHGLMKLDTVESSDGGGAGQLVGELRLTPQEFLASYCGLYYKISISSDAATGQMTNFTFNAPECFGPDMQVIGSKLRVLQKPLRAQAGRCPGQLDYLYGIEQKERPNNLPDLEFKDGDVVINSLWTFMEANRTEICFVCRKTTVSS